jgi:hypothetical protein
MYTESNLRCISAVQRLLDSRGETASSATDFFVETKVVVCDVEFSQNLLPTPVTASKKQQKREKRLVAVAVVP